LAIAFNLVSSQKILWCDAFETTCTFDHEDIAEYDQVIVKGNHSWGTIDDDIWQIWFENSRIHFLPSDIFSVFRNVFFLMAPGQELKEIRPETFLDAANLDTIELSNNKIDKLGEDSFKSAYKVSMIFLFNNEIEEIHENAFRGLRDLVALDMSSNKLKVLPIEIFNPNVLLISVSLESNYLNSISFQSFEPLIQLGFLSLENNVCIDKRYYMIEEFVTIQKDLVNCGMPFVNEAARTTKTESLRADLEIFNSNFESLEDILGIINESLVDIVDRIEDIEHILKNKTTV
jgi:hypothetical protein